MVDELAATGPSRRQTYFRYKFWEDASLREKLLGRKEGFWNRRASGNCAERVNRCANLARFSLVLAGSMVTAMAPWGLALVELATMLTLYVWLDPDALLVWKHPHSYRFHFSTSLEDVLCLSLFRTLSVLLAYALGSGKFYQRPYMYTAAAFATVASTYVAAKWALLVPHSRTAATMILAASLGFTVAHVATAYKVMRWAQRRYEMGLNGFGYPWEEGEEAWLLLNHRAEAGAPLPKVNADDVPPRSLADADSRFVMCGPLEVHYKEWSGVPGGGASDAAVVFVHGFGAGVFAWRHVAGPLAVRAGVRVIAFDRPGFGLTSRPDLQQVLAWGQAGVNPYTPAAHARLVHSLCATLRVRRAVMVGHGDGALVACVAAAGCNDARSAGSGPQEEVRLEVAPVPGCTGPPQDVGLDASSQSGPCGPWSAAGLGLLHPVGLCGEDSASFVRLLSSSRMGRRVLRPLLRSSAVGAVSDRRVWADPGRLAPQTLALYRSPLRVDGWDRALLEVSRGRWGERNAADAEAALRAAAQVPATVVTGAADRLVPKARAAQVAEALPRGSLVVLPDCGHLSHEEAPGALVDVLAPFVANLLSQRA